MKYEFKYYLHGGKPWEDDDFEWLQEKFGLPEDVAERICDKRPFYEVEIDAVYDSETDEVTMTGVRST